MEVFCCLRGLSLWVSNDKVAGVSERKAGSIGNGELRYLVNINGNPSHLPLVAQSLGFQFQCRI